jgi:hypothetical protein
VLNPTTNISYRLPGIMERWRRCTAIVLAYVIGALALIAVGHII